MNPSLSLSQFDYYLPPELIAQTPADLRRSSRLLHLDARSALHDRHFSDLPTLLRRGDLLVFNDTRVIRARLRGHKATGGKVEILVDQLIGPDRALAHIKASKSPKPGSAIVIGEGFPVEVVARADELFELRFPEPVLTFLERHGVTPLPPYIHHDAASSDDERYQTVYAQKPGAVAAPTAGLHFDQAMLQELSTQGIGQAFVTLHVGAGTFQPVRVGNLAEHRMHAEHYVVPADVLTKIAQTRQNGGRIVAVGTTSVRALESVAASAAESVAASAVKDIPHGPSRLLTKDGLEGDTRLLTKGGLEGDTRLFITPGYEFLYVDALITNFHLPRSTLLMLVSALAGLDPIHRAYAHAVRERYRFFSYGDAMFIESPAP